MAKINPLHLNTDLIRTILEYGQLRQTILQAIDLFNTALPKMEHKISQPVKSLDGILNHLREAHVRSREIEQCYPALEKALQKSPTGESKLNSELYESLQALHKRYQDLESLLPPQRSDGASISELTQPKQLPPNQYWI